MPLVFSWLAAVMLGVGLVVVAVVPYFARYREEPGGWWWLGALGCMATYSVAYGIGLLVLDPGIRWVFTALRLAVAGWASVAFVGFALGYTGRSHYRRSWVFRVYVLLHVGWTVVLFTNPLHHLVWSEYALAPAYGAATVTFGREPLAFGMVGVIWLAMAFAVALLFDTIVSYGPLYRTQALAIAVTPFPVAVASVVWLFELGPHPHVDLVPLSYLPHIALDAYALFWGGMFALTPAARRAGERAAVDDLGTPVVIVDDDRQVVNLNDAAESVFGVGRRAALGEPMADALGVAVDPAADDETVIHRVDGRRREFDVVGSTVDDASGRRVAHTITFHDVTRERQRKQRLAVLNRVLRHNLRNSLTAARGYLDLVEDDAADDDTPDAPELARRADENLARLDRIAEKASDARQVLDRGPDVLEPVAVADVLDRLVAEFRETRPDAEFRVDCPNDLTAVADEHVLETVLGNLLENAIEHTDAAKVEVTAEVETSGGRDQVRVDVADRGPGIPDHERAVIVEGEETPLEHGSGLGLWLVKWGVSELGGDLEFADNEPRGSVVTVRLPAAEPTTVGRG